MNYKKFSKTYSYSRTFRYYKAAGKDKKKAKDMYARIVDFLSWIDPDILKEMKLENLDSVEEVIKENEQIINKPRTADV